MSQTALRNLISALILVNEIFDSDDESTDSDDESTDSENELYQDEEELNEPSILTTRVSTVSRRNVPKVAGYEEIVTERMQDYDFKTHFRLHRSTFDLLLGKINIKLQNQTRPTSRCSPNKMLLITLWILATPESYRSVGCRFGVCKKTVFKVIRRTIDAIYEMASTTIKWPGATEAQNIISANSSTAGFPGVLGAIDGTHIPIRTPQHSSGTYINRKGFHSLQLQVVCQHNLKFTDCNVGQPGSMHDARVFRHSEICTDLQNSTLFFPEDSHLIGDAAYPLSDRLLTPYRDTGNLTRYQVRYNFKLSSTRMSVERAIGILKCRFRRLRFFDSPDLAFISKSVIAACTLHNFCIDENDLHFENSEELSSGGAATINSENNIYNSTVTARAKRDRIARLL
ncbi:putative nuclease HARBI1 isoform X1 [Artemia franciscana]|uniref:Putative nuclease HARBI1 n=1 Tax=Artemia franciscana TaxID=6661 RepID=A0AA88IFW4_ARTSF|nr:hypothetical protein QYM36_008168 [Artemia franciscana]